MTFALTIFIHAASVALQTVSALTNRGRNFSPALNNFPVLFETSAREHRRHSGGNANNDTNTFFKKNSPVLREK